MATKKHKTTRSGKGNNGGGYRTKITPKKKEEFLLQVAETGGNITKASELVGIPRRTFYEHRDKDKEFAERWDVALDKGIDRLEEEAKRRAFEGVEEPVFYKGKRVDFVKKYSDVLLIFLLKGHRAKYKERHEITGETKLNVGITDIAEAFAGIDTETIRSILSDLRNGDRKKGNPQVVSRFKGPSDNQQ